MRDGVLVLSAAMKTIELEKIPRQWCQCENISHDEGGSGHPYAVEADDAGLVVIKTTFGPFTVCTTCRDTCHRRS